MKSKKNEDGPSCACGKVDLYEGMIRMNEETEKDSSDDNAVKKVPKQSPIKNKVK